MQTLRINLQPVMTLETSETRHCAEKTSIWEKMDFVGPSVASLSIGLRTLRQFLVWC